MDQNIPPIRPKPHTEPPFVCPCCGQESDYSRRYDAYYCSHCDLWLEEACTSPCCEFCAGRPERPSQIPPGTPEA